jgi:hypothetical protein
LVGARGLEPPVRSSGGEADGSGPFGRSALVRSQAYNAETRYAAKSG